jgi:ferredoxin
VQLKAMAQRGLIAAGRAKGGLGFRLLPFAVGFYEQQLPHLDVELAQLVEDYFWAGMGAALAQTPPAHRVIPVQRTVQSDMEVQPYESAAALLARRQAWAVMPCICRKQKALVGEPCGHPMDVCMAMSDTPGAFDHAPGLKALTLAEAQAALQMAAEAGLVHTTSNNQEEVGYICNCCTCGCGILRGMAELGMANVVARSAFVNQVDGDRCAACGACVEHCSFAALSQPDGGVAVVDARRCVGCGVCVLTCPEEALGLVRRPEAEVLPPPETAEAWRARRLAERVALAGAAM